MTTTSADAFPPDLQRDVPLSPRCTLQLGGPARYFIEARAPEALRRAIAWAQARGLPWTIWGGGSNLVVADTGFPGLVIRMGLRGREVVERGSEILLDVAAGEVWDEVVSDGVAQGWAGIECLGGIPGLVGATPIQNVGAYGQEVGEVIDAVQVLDVASLNMRWLEASECGFGYRDSAFKREPGRFVVLVVRLRLRSGGPPSIRYAELERALNAHAKPTLRQVRDTVVRLRRSKSMVICADDPNRRSAGSFFTNPIVTSAEAVHIGKRAVEEGWIGATREVPQYPMADGRIKLAAGWLIERAGIQRGLRRGPVGISSAHTLALVHHGGGRTADLLSLAREVRDRVEQRFGVRLVPEPVMLGFDGDPLC